MKIEQKGDTLVITIDTSAEARKSAVASKSGKTMVLDTTHGFTRYGDVSVSMTTTIPKAATA